MNLNEAKQIIVSLGKTSKMPCPSYNTPATLCVTGSRLRKMKGSTCNGCYAMKGNYLYTNVQEGLYKRFNAFDHPRFTEAMFYMINHYSKKSGYFRWFDSGDLANIHMLEKIVLVCQNTPTIKHWLPTREVKIVKDYLKTAQLELDAKNTSRSEEALKKVNSDKPILLSQWSIIEDKVKRREYSFANLVSYSPFEEDSLFSDLGEEVEIPKTENDYKLIKYNEIFKQC